MPSSLLAQPLISESVRKSMRSNRSRGTKPELQLSEMLHKRLARNALPGSPEFVFPRKRVVIFVHGCFWHRCPICAPKLPKTNRAFWAEKFRQNKIRDLRVERELKSVGWKVVKVWEHELKRNPAKVLARIRRDVGRVS